MNNPRSLNLVEASPKRYRSQLYLGMAIAPLFYGVVTAQMLTKEGFDITRHPLSLLALGQTGWIQTLNFLITGVMAIAVATGLRRRLTEELAGTWGPILTATFGVGFIITGVSPADPLPGFPPGAVTTVAPAMSGHAIGHGIGFMIAFASLTANCLVFATRFSRRRERGWMLYSLASGILTIALIALGMANQKSAGVSFFTSGIVAFVWLGAVCAHLGQQDEAGSSNRAGSA